MEKKEETNEKLPLCVDCDGTLIQTDLLYESLLSLIKLSFKSLFVAPFWLLRGKAFFKQQVASRASIDAATLPYNDRMLVIIRTAREQGRAVSLVTAAPEKFANSIAQYLGLFDSVMSTTNQENLAGSAKAERLERAYGRGRFVYAGNSRADLPVWAVSGGAIVVSSSQSLVDSAARRSPVLEVIPQTKFSIRVWLRAIRVHQWLKNVLVFVPLLAAHRLSDAAAIREAVLAFFAFSFCSSAVYIINDLLDLTADRLHKRKMNRPFASGKIPVPLGLLGAGFLLASAMLVCAFLAPIFAIVLTAYFLLTCLYSFWLKGQVIVDVMLLASLYTSRILAGAAATAIVPSFWLLAFSMFVFLSLALIKRYSEMQALHLEMKVEAAGRGYSVNDEPVLLSLGTSAGYGAVLILALYVNSVDLEGLYPNRWALWLMLPPILYWISRAWLKAHRGELHDDPIVFAVTDRQSWALVVCLAGVLWFATFH